MDMGFDRLQKLVMDREDWCVVINTVKGFDIVNKAEIYVYMLFQ